MGPQSVHARFEMKYVNSDFTKFMFGVQYTCLTISVIVCALYIMGACLLAYPWQ